MSARKKLALGMVITGLVLVAIGIIIGVTAITPVWVPIALLALDAVLTIVGLPLLYKPDLPA